MTMTDSTRRALRVLAHGLVAFVIAVPVMAAALPTPAGRIADVAAAVVALCAVAAKVINALEDAGLIPAVLKAPASDGADPIPSPPHDTTSTDTKD